MSSDKKKPSHDVGRDRQAVEVGDENLVFRPLDVGDQVPTGRQLLKAASLYPVEDYVIFGVTPGGDLEDIRLEETFDLRGKGIERVVAMKADATYRVFVDGREFAWKRLVTGAVLKRLVGADPESDLFLEVRGDGDDVQIADGELVDLTKEGVERFYTARKAVRTFEIVVNSRLRLLPEAKVTFEQVVQFAFPGHHMSNVVFSMTYRHAASKPSAGELGAGGFVVAKQKGTVFNVTRTVQS